ncbi:fluoride efflux transporter CrcB [Polaromonas sp. C04]|uniref:fluoride efflux transporter CrcB n=1 Tax=Polaromonas sp. C04 TaxID=1945857 RepID=UPI0009857A85|nr:fluoride efflux transporter CrcB [Polaromonas sp. C04]OOG60446.1 fluoride ion transporter CrcB [Polaromonas sp. C04]
MSGLSFLAIFGGAGCGALLRWQLGAWLNPVFPTLPLGTVAANLIGGLLIGLANSFLTHYSELAPEWRLLIITGFLGGLTTFSTFSLEAVTLLSRQEYAWALGHMGIHLIGSLLFTAIGILIVSAVVKI